MLTIDASSNACMTHTQTPAHPLQHTHKMKRAISDATKGLVCVRKEGQYEGRRTEGQHGNLILKKVKRSKKQRSLSALVRWHQKHHQKWMPSTLITTNNIGLAAFGGLLMERDGKQKCRFTRKTQQRKSARMRDPHDANEVCVAHAAGCHDQDTTL